MKRQHWPLWLLGSVIFGAMLAWWVPRLEWQEVTERSAPRGEAARDNNHAMHMLLGRLGASVTLTKDLTRLDELPLGSTLLLEAPLSEPVARKMENRILEWVKRGGHLVLIVSGPEQSDRFTETIGLERLGRHTNLKGEKLQLGIRTLSVSLSGCDVFRIGATPLWSASVSDYKQYDWAEDEDEEPEESDATTSRKAAEPALAFAGWQHGAGRISALCEDGWFGNDTIGKFDHAEIAARVLLDDPVRPVFVAQREHADGLLGWLYRHAAHALVALGVLIALVLWRAMPRFGPIRPDARPSRPGLGVHLRAVGAFLLRRREWVLLLAAPRETVLRQAARFILGGTPTPADIAALAGIDVRELETALVGVPRNRAGYERAAMTLGRVLDVLRAHRPDFQLISSDPHQSKAKPQ